MSVVVVKGNIFGDSQLKIHRFKETDTTIGKTYKPSFVQSHLNSYSNYVNTIKYENT